MAGKSASDFDVRLGQRLREARIAAGLSQSEVGRFIGVSFQQVQRYERGVNRLPGSAFAILHARLGLAAEDVLGLEDRPNIPATQSLMKTPGSDELVRLYDRLDPAARRLLIKLAKDLLERSSYGQPGQPGQPGQTPT